MGFLGNNRYSFWYCLDDPSLSILTEICWRGIKSCGVTITINDTKSQTKIK